MDGNDPLDLWIVISAAYDDDGLPMVVTEVGEGNAWDQCGDRILSYRHQLHSEPIGKLHIYMARNIPWSVGLAAVETLRHLLETGWRVNGDWRSHV